MSTVMHPVGPQPQRVYWIRRILLVAVALVAVAVVVGLLTRGPAAGADGIPDAEDTATDPDAPADPAAAAGDPGTGPCTGAQLTVTLTTDTRAYPVGTSPVLTVGLTNSGTVSCTVDAGDTGREIVISSGADRIWSSLDCPPEPAERLLLLAPGALDVVDVSWPRVRSAPGCAAGLPEPRPGTYNAVVTVLGTPSAAAVFELG